MTDPEQEVTYNPLSNFYKSLKEQPDLLQYFQDQSDEFYLRCVKRVSQCFRYIPNKNIEISVAACAADIRQLEFVEDKTDEFYKLVLDINPFIISKIDNPSDELCKVAIYADANVFQHIKNPSYEICKYAVTVSPAMVKHIDSEITDEIYNIVISSSIWFIPCLKYPKTDDCIRYLNVGGKLENIKNPPKELINYINIINL